VAGRAGVSGTRFHRSAARDKIGLAAAFVGAVASAGAERGVVTSEAWHDKLVWEFGLRRSRAATAVP